MKPFLIIGYRRSGNYFFWNLLKSKESMEKLGYTKEGVSYE